MKRTNDLAEFYRGCLIGGAIGDALGYPVEFLSLEEIKAKYGIWGITDYDLASNGKALISDDTQMTLFTANGILNGETQFRYRGTVMPLVNYIYYAYMDWLTTQGYQKNVADPSRKDSWLVDVPELHNRRSPGQTCINTLLQRGGDREITLNKPVNDRKGCGAVMRIAPLGLIAHKYGDPFVESARIGGITHGHPMSHLSCQLMTLIINNMFKYDDKSLWTIIKDSIRELKYRYDEPQPYYLRPIYDLTKEYVPEFFKLMKNALIKVKYVMIQEKRGNMVKDSDIIASLGQGWVAEEALAIAIYCAVRHNLDPMEGIRAAVNHDGDTDSTGALTGQILGAFHGLKAFPQEYIKNLELSDVIMEIADDLAQGCKFSPDDPPSKEKEMWETKYIQHNRFTK